MKISLERFVDEHGRLSLGQEAFIQRFNRCEKIMVDAADLYQAGKEGNRELLQSLCLDFLYGKLVTSTRLIYHPNALEGTVFHNYKSLVIQPQQNDLTIPDYSIGESLDNVLNSQFGLSFLQELFKTEDNRDEIENCLYQLSGKPSDKVLILTRCYNRAKLLHLYPRSRPVIFEYNFDCLYDDFTDCELLIGDGRYGNSGYTHNVDP